MLLTIALILLELWEYPEKRKIGIYQWLHVLTVCSHAPSDSLSGVYTTEHNIHAVSHSSTYYLHDVEEIFHFNRSYEFATCTNSRVSRVFHPLSPSQLQSISLETIIPCVRYYILCKRLLARSNIQAWIISDSGAPTAFKDSKGSKYAWSV